MSVKLPMMSTGTVVLGLFLSPACLSTAAGQTGGVETFTNQTSTSTTTTTVTSATTAVGLTLDAAGWTVLKKSADTRVVYVSNSAGNDSNDGLSEARPKKTIAAGYALLRHGSPDWLLLKAGDTWNEGLGHWRKSGRSATERMVVNTYGSSRARPVLKTGETEGFRRHSGSGSPTSIDNLAIVGLSFSAAGRSATSNPSGMLWLDDGKDILVEDCVFDGYGTNMNVQGFRGRVTNFAIRRCEVLNSYVVNSHSQGLIVSKVDGLDVSESLFDHNGWSQTVSAAVPTIFNHNVYIQSDCGPVKFSGNTVLRASSHGAQVRAGGTVTGNVFAQNAIGLLVGGGDSPVPGGVTATVKGNVILSGTDIGTSLRGFGIDLKNISGGEVSGNLVANKVSTNPAFAIGSWVSGGPVGVGVRNLLISGNTIRDWRGGIQFNDPGTTSYVGIRVESNRIESSLSGDTTPLVRLSVAPSGMSFRLNRYTAPSANARPFDNRGTRLTLSGWSTAVGEQDASLTTAAAAAPAVTLEGLVGRLTKRTLTFDQAVLLLKQRRLHEWPVTASGTTLSRLALAPS